MRRVVHDDLALAVGCCSASCCSPPAGRSAERGVALVLALIFSILLYILVAELVVSSGMVRQTGENDARLARMRTLMAYQLVEAEDKLLSDLGGDEEAGGLGGLEGLGGGAGGLGGLGGAGGGEAGGEEGEDPAANCDSSRDSWFDPVGHPDNDLITYVWIEDENRKFNLLSIWSPDEDYARESRDGLVRLIDSLREDTPFDVTSGDALLIVQRIVDWARRPSTVEMPTPLLKSVDENDRELCIPLHLDELLMVEGIDEELFFDKVFDQQVHHGLESVLTIWTSLRPDPGDPEKLARQRAIAEARGSASPARAGESAQPADPASPGASGPEQGPPAPEGLGAKVNINTTTRPVLRALFAPDRVPDRVIDAILRYRDEIDEEATQASQEENYEQASEFGDMQLGDDVLRRFFETAADLEQVEEYAQIADDEIKQEIQRKLTTRSEVFSIHLATLFKSNDEERSRVYQLQRARSIVLRLEDGDEPRVLPLVPYEERVGIRLQPLPFRDDDYYDPSERYQNMDQFAQEERAWNPFLLDFYLPPEERARFYGDR